MKYINISGKLISAVTALCLSLPATAQINLAGAYEGQVKDGATKQLYLTIDFLNGTPDFTQVFTGKYAPMKILPKDFMNAKKLSKKFQGTTAPGFGRFKDCFLFSTTNDMKITNPVINEHGIIVADVEWDNGYKIPCYIVADSDGNLKILGLHTSETSVVSDIDKIELQLVENRLPDGTAPYVTTPEAKAWLADNYISRWELTHPAGNSQSVTAGGSQPDTAGADVNLSITNKFNVAGVYAGDSSENLYGDRVYITLDLLEGTPDFTQVVMDGQPKVTTKCDDMLTSVELPQAFSGNVAPGYVRYSLPYSSGIHDIELYNPRLHEKSGAILVDWISAKGKKGKCYIVVYGPHINVIGNLEGGDGITPDWLGATMEADWLPDGITPYETPEADKAIDYIINHDFPEFKAFTEAEGWMSNPLAKMAAFSMDKMKHSSKKERKKALKFAGKALKNPGGAAKDAIKGVPHEAKKMTRSVTRDVKKETNKAKKKLKKLF